MDRWHSKGIETSRLLRNAGLGWLSRVCLACRITPNMLTAVSLLCGLLSMYFVFFRYGLFLLFGFLHLLFDALDGVAARATKETTFGTYFDMGTDSLITIIALTKTGWFLQDMYAYAVAGLFTLALVVHMFSRLTAPIIFMRTGSLLLLMIFTFPSIPHREVLLTGGYLVAGIFTVYSLARQLQWMVARMNRGQ